MTEKLRRIMARQSETRERLNHLLGIDEPSDAETRELTDLRSKAQGLETELREALDDPESATEPGEPGGATVDPETRERLEIRERTGIAHFVNAAIGGRAVDGAAAEYAAAVGVPAMGHVPMDIFRDGRPETREITPGPAVDGVVHAGRSVRVRAVGRGVARRADAEYGRGPGADPEDHDCAAGRHAGEGRLGSGHCRGRGAGQPVAQARVGPVRDKSRGPRRLQRSRRRARRGDAGQSCPTSSTRKCSPALRPD